MTTAIDARLRDGIAAARAKRLEEARALLQECVDAAPNNPLAWFWLAVVSPTGEGAISHLRRVLALDPSHTAAKEALAKLLFTQADRMRDNARRLFRDAAAAAPEDPRIWRAVVQLAATSAEALAAVRELRALAPDFADGTRHLREALVVDARALKAAGNRVAARQRWHEAAALEERDIDAWLGLAESTDDQAERCDAVTRAAALDPLHPGVVAMQERIARELFTAHPSANDPITATSIVPALAAVTPDAGPASLAVARSDDAPTSIVPPTPVARATVLVIDDSPTIRKILSLTLEREGYSVIAETDGESALKRLSDLVPDVILLDIAMPGIDGYETCKRIRSDARTAHLPILMLSGKDALFDKVKGHMAGATEYLTKPFEAATVIAAVAGACAQAA